MTIPVRFRLNGTADLERKINRINKGLNNLAVKNGAVAAAIEKINREAKRRIISKGARRG